MKEKIKKEIQEFTEMNETMKSAAFIVGFDIDAETDKLLESVDQRIRTNLWQRYAIKAFNILLK